MKVGLASTGNGPVNGRTADAEKRSDGLRRFALFNQLSGVADLLRRQFRLASEFHAPALRSLNTGVCALGD